MASEESILAAMQQPLTSWKRPERLKQPRIWYKENGVVVRDLTPDLYPFAIEHLRTHYLRDEPMNQACGSCDDPQTVEEISMIWSHMILPEEVSIIALPEDTPGANLETVSAENPPDVIGLNQLSVCTKFDPPVPDFRTILQSDINKLCISTFFQCGALVNVFEKYDVDTYLEGAGMSVAAKWRGKGVGQILIKGREALCKEMGIAVTKTVFTAIQSQKVALKGGFELLGEMNYADLKLPNGDACFPNMHPDQQKLQLMAKRVL